MPLRDRFDALIACIVKGDLVFAVCEFVGKIESDGCASRQTDAHRGFLDATIRFS